MRDFNREHAADYHIVMVRFDGEKTAGRALDRVRVEGGLGECEIEGEAIVSRNAAGDAHFHERGSAGVGATFGVATALLLGLVTGPMILPVMMVAGGLAGGVAGHYAGRVLPAEDLRRLGDTLAPGTSAYVAIVDAEHAPCVATSFEPEGAVVVNAPVLTEFANAIREAVTHRVRRD